MGVFKKDNRWYIDYYLPDGKRKRETVTIPGVDPIHINRQDALKALSIRKAQIAEGKFEIAQTKKPILFDKFVDRYIEYSRANKRSWTRDVVSSKALLKTFSGKNLGQINSWLVEKYKVQRTKDISRHGRPITKATINRELACLKHMFTKAIEWNFITDNPVKKVKLFTERPNKLRVLSNEEFQMLYNEASEFLKPILIFAINTGARQNEILKLRWEDIDLAQGYIYVRDTKNNESRNIPTNETLMKTIDQLKNNSESEFVFAYKNGDPVKSVKTAFYSALRRSKIEKCRFHDLRHTFATRLVMAGVDIVTVKELLGHKDISMTMRYSHPTPLHKMKAVESLNFETLDTYLDTRNKIKQAG